MDRVERDEHEPVGGLGDGWVPICDASEFARPTRARFNFVTIVSGCALSQATYLRDSVWSASRCSKGPFDLVARPLKRAVNSNFAVTTHSPEPTRSRIGADRVPGISDGSTFLTSTRVPSFRSTSVFRPV